MYFFVVWNIFVMLLRNSIKYNSTNNHPDFFFYILQKRKKEEAFYMKQKAHNFTETINMNKTVCKNEKKGGGGGTGIFLLPYHFIFPNF